jgi:Flp pilus assembly protein TadB
MATAVSPTRGHASGVVGPPELRAPRPTGTLRRDVSIAAAISSIGQEGSFETPDRLEATAMKLPTNESTIDRVLRIVLGLAVAAVSLAGAIVAPWLYVAWVVAAILVVTGIVGFCPLYAIFRLSTKSRAH